MSGTGHDPMDVRAADEPHERPRCTQQVRRCTTCETTLARFVADDCPKCGPGTTIVLDRCRNPALRDSPKCWTHSPERRAPQVVAAQRRRHLEADVAAVIDLAGEPVVSTLDLWKRLAAHAGRVLAFGEELQRRVERLTTWVGVDAFGRAELDPTVAAYQRALRDIGRFSVDLARLDLAALVMQAETALREHERDVLEAVVVAALAHFGVAATDEVRAVLFQEFERRGVVVDAGPAVTTGGGK